MQSLVETELAGTKLLDRKLIKKEQTTGKIALRFTANWLKVGRRERERERVCVNI